MITRLVRGGNDARRRVSERIATFYAILSFGQNSRRAGNRAIDKKRQETINNATFL